MVLATMLLVVVGTLGFIAVYDLMQGGRSESFDRFVIEFASKHRGPQWFQTMARDITALGGGTVLTLTTASVLVFLLLRRQYHAFWFVLAAIAGGFLISANLKEIIGRERPTIFEPATIIRNKSFPSGHAMMSAVVYLTLGTLLMRLVKERFLKAYFFVLASILTFLIGLSRLYLGVHWPTDVLAGWAGGLVWALLCYEIARILQKRGVVERDTEAAKN